MSNLTRAAAVPLGATLGVAVVLWLARDRGEDGKNRAATSKPTGAIAFVRGGPGDRMLPGEVMLPSGMGIFVADLATGAETRVTRPRMLATMPAWSPDGRLLAFSRYVVHGDEAATNELAAVRPDGRGLRPLSACGSATTCGGDGGPSYSPDSAKLGFFRVTHRGVRIVVANRDGSSPASLGALAGVSAFGGPSWSRDGRRFAFAASRGNRGPIDLYVARADGGEVRRITDCRRSGCDGYTAAAWSPVGDDLVAARAGGGGLELMRADGAVVRALTARCGAHCEDADPAWSPDGRFVAFARRQPSGSAIYAIGAHGGGLRRLTQTAPYVCCPSWRPPVGASK